MTYNTTTTKTGFLNSHTADNNSAKPSSGSCFCQIQDKFGFYKSPHWWESMKVFYGWITLFFKAHFTWISENPNRIWGGFFWRRLEVFTDRTRPEYGRVRCEYGRACLLRHPRSVYGVRKQLYGAYSPRVRCVASDFNDVVIPRYEICAKIHWNSRKICFNKFRVSFDLSHF